MTCSSAAYLNQRNNHCTMGVFKTITFAQHDGVDIDLDYMLPQSPSSDSKLPILLWFHGGGLLQGTRTCEWCCAAKYRRPSLIITYRCLGAFSERCREIQALPRFCRLQAGTSNSYARHHGGHQGCYGLFAIPRVPFRDRECGWSEQDHRIRWFCWWMACFAHREWGWLRSLWSYASRQATRRCASLSYHRHRRLILHYQATSWVGGYVVIARVALIGN